MPSGVVQKNLGVVTAYGYAKAGGYTGTEEEFTEMIGNLNDDASSASASATAAANSATSAANSASTAGDKVDAANTLLTAATNISNERFEKKYTVTTSTSSFTFDPTGYTYASGDRFEVYVDGAKLTDDAYSNSSATVTLTTAVNNCTVEIICYRSTTFATDTTLSIAGAAADSKKTGDEITALKDDLEYIDTAIGTGYKVISGAYMNASGVIVAGAAYDTWCFKVKNGGKINTLTSTAALVYAFYASEPSIGSVSYNESRTVLPTDTTISNLSVPSGTNWIAVRVLAGGTVALDPVSYIGDLYKNAKNQNVKVFSVGNSLFTGSVYPNGVYGHLADTNDAPYSILASALGAYTDNVNHTLISSTGFLYNAGNGTFLSHIKSSDISGYDYLITHLYMHDVSNFQLGSEDSISGDGSIVGGIYELLDYIAQENSKCSLVLVGVVPSSTIHYGSNVFSDNYGQGYSIIDLDSLLHSLANKKNFIYIDWQSMPLSYIYHDYTASGNIHPSDDSTYRTMGEYLARQIRYEDKNLTANYDALRETQDDSSVDFGEISAAYGKNLYNWHTTKEYVFLNASTGEEEYSALNDTSDYIEIPTTTISMRDLLQQGVTTNYRVYFYDANKQFIERQVLSTSDTATFTVPDGAEYFRIVIPHKTTSDLRNSKYMILAGTTTIVTYVPYLTAVDRIARDSIATIESRFVTPPPMLTIIDDDGHLDYKNYLLPFCKEVNAPISTAVTPLRFGGQSGVGRYMTAEEIKECMVEGAEVICHTYTHTADNADIKHIGVQDGTYVNSTTFNDEQGVVVTGSTEIVYHDITTDKYYTYSGTAYSEINNVTITNIQKLIDVYVDVSGYYDGNGSPCYSTKNDYYIDKLAKYYTIARNILYQYGFIDANILVYNNDTGYETISHEAAKRVFRCGFDINGARINRYGSIDRNQVHRYNTDAADINRYKTLIDSLATNGGWMVWCIHTTGTQWRNDRESFLATLKEAIEYAHSKNIAIVTASYGCSAYIDGMV